MQGFPSLDGIGAGLCRLAGLYTATPLALSGVS
jgi:hypothetical protein